MGKKRGEIEKKVGINTKWINQKSRGNIKLAMVKPYLNKLFKLQIYLTQDSR